MSIKYMNWTWSLPLPHAPKILLLAIADYANDEGVAWPGQGTLCTKTGMSRATLNKYLKVLKELNLINTKAHAAIGTGRKVNTYTINSTVELINSMRPELIGKFNEIKDGVARPISSTLIHRRVQASDTKSMRVEHDPSFISSVIEPSVIQGTEIGCIDHGDVRDQSSVKSGSAKGLNQNAWREYEAYRHRKGLPKLSGQSMEEEKLRLAEYGGYAEQIAIVIRVQGDSRLNYIPRKCADGA